ncbi:histidyl-tRNA synthetase [Anseongella ginsenosidimutans]|uniref:Histidine--tRNA ligase n=1 Tax=Anseongella ginsenosidimutans TaxID=496056 RepID=A0A4R3KUP7_9SPHI|nr:histidine--tRNA ligase [Anseongella ginsenosidimutans]QEC51781.1 histidine--tRNA ligase [Anseongella ginsenosidimutans]TCS89149.1 histidyl-tRNA synthetase [Anseongella ginsenosidimutans]
MAKLKPSIPKGTRDFSPEVVAKRNFIFDTIRSVFYKFGFQPIETPAMENLDTLTGKYGDEGDQLIFKILNSGDYLSKAGKDTLEARDSRKLTPEIAEKALRYDLTVPFARYVVMHQHEITFPFKRYQVQPVWRADRPQKGRYREFYQCDADVVGSESLLNEAEFILIYDQVLSTLGLKEFTIRINNRKILSGIAELTGKPEKMMDLTIAIDKLDKIGADGVEKELLSKGFTTEDIEKISPFLGLGGTNPEKLDYLKSSFAASETGLKGIEELETVFTYLSRFNMRQALVSLDITLARGLNYYTGAILEVRSEEVKMGSLGGGGRYDDLTGMFGLSGLTGVGISFGADRIFDVMEELKLFPPAAALGTRLLITNFDKEGELYALELLQQLRNKDVAVELYPSPVKLQKQFKYADARNIPYVLIIGPEEMETGELTLKNMKSGEQEKITAAALPAVFSNES